MHAQPFNDARSLEPQELSTSPISSWWKPWGRSKRRSGGPQQAKGPAADRAVALGWQAPARSAGEPMSEDDAFLQRIRRAGL